MTSKFMRLSLAVAVFFAISALAQTSSAAATPATTPAAPAATTGANTATKVGAINIEGAIFGSNEGNRDLETLGKKFEPKKNELKSQSDEIDALKKQLTTQADKLNEDALNELRKKIETKQKSLDRSLQDAQEEFGQQQQEIANRILQKMAPMIVKYAQDNGFGMIIDISKQWPQGPVLMAGEGVDITKAVLDAYNAQSGVPAPAAGGAAAKPTAPKSAAPKPATKPADAPK